MQEKNPCENCLSFCKADCCRLFVVKLNNKDSVTGKHFKINIPFDMNLIKYYEYHGCKYFRGTLYIPLENYKIENNVLYVYNQCINLTADYLCKINDKKPFVCKDFNSNTKKKYYVPERCQYYEKSQI